LLFQQFKVYCSWSKVVRFEDPSTCAVESVHSRCEAVSREEWVKYHDPCEVDWTDGFTHWTAILSQSELVNARGTIMAPVLYEDHGVCAEGNVPPPPQPICSCTEVACDAQ
jgi:hypothetical protein